MFNLIQISFTIFASFRFISVKNFPIARLLLVSSTDFVSSKLGYFREIFYSLEGAILFWIRAWLIFHLVAILPKTLFLYKIEAYHTKRSPVIRKSTADHPPFFGASNCAETSHLLGLQIFHNSEIFQTKIWLSFVLIIDLSFVLAKW